MIEVSGVKLNPAKVKLLAVFCGEAPGVMEEMEGPAAVIVKFEAFEVAVPAVTKICAVPMAVSSVFGTLTVMLVAEEAAPDSAVVGVPVGGIQVAVVPPIAKPVPVMTTLWVALFCTAVLGLSKVIVGAGLVCALRVTARDDARTASFH